MTDVPFAAVSRDASARPHHPANSVTSADEVIE